MEARTARGGADAARDERERAAGAPAVDARGEEDVLEELGGQGLQRGHVGDGTLGWDVDEARGGVAVIYGPRK